MSNQPEALYLAEVIESDPQSKAHHDAAASCLRRQHAEIERLYAQRFSAVEDYEKAPDWSLLEATHGALREHMAEIHKLRAERDVLREALRLVEPHLPFDWAFDSIQEFVGRNDYREACAKARALIANATGENK